MDASWQQVSQDLGVIVDQEVVKYALGGIDKTLSKAKRALQEVEMEAFGGGDDLGGYESPTDAMVFHLEELHDHLLVVLEAAQMEETRTDLVIRWAEFKKAKNGLRNTKRFGDFDQLDSPPLEYIDRLVSALRMTVSDQISSEEAWNLARLEEMLEDTSALVLRRGAAPADEIELQKIMHDYLRACFSDFVFNPKIGGTIKSFIPDCGIRSINAAIEFKIAHTKEQAVKAYSGIVEDTAGYKGSKDWTRFFAIIYQAKPFLPKSHLQSDMQRIKAATWTPILVNGETTRKTRSPKKMKRSLTKAKAVKKARGVQ
jgi:hypothetical protein